MPDAEKTVSDPGDLITVRTIGVDWLSDVYDIDVREHGDIVYHVVDGRLRATAEEWNRPARTRESWDRHIAEWTQMLEAGGCAWGAYNSKHRPVGIVVLRPHLTDTMAQLAALFVTHDYRRTGIATRLTQELIATARTSGARQLYVSATPSRSAVGFYHSQGFTLADRVHPELFTREPEDIHMILDLYPPTS
jgi:N-acetylglutamate synthase-like GNAT family acetyltransferase